MTLPEAVMEHRATMALAEAEALQDRVNRPSTTTEKVLLAVMVAVVLATGAWSVAAHACTAAEAAAGHCVQACGWLNQCRSRYQRPTK